MPQLRTAAVAVLATRTTLPQLRCDARASNVERQRRRSSHFDPVTDPHRCTCSLLRRMRTHSNANGLWRVRRHGGGRIHGLRSPGLVRGQCLEEALVKSRGEVLEGIAFQFCKVATVAVLAGRYVLPVASGLCALFFVWAWLSGKKDTRCVGKHPLLIATFWLLVCTGSVWLLVAGRHFWIW